MNILITGAGGYIGDVIARLISRQHTVLTPKKSDLDITERQSVFNYFSAHKVNVVVHAAAFTDNDAAEKERGDKSGACWQTNVAGTKNIVDAARKIGAFVIYISTGSVFAGDTNNPGPFAEDDPPSPEHTLSWYAWTKRVAETSITDGAIIRLSHPNIARIIESKFPLFTDQRYPISYLPDVGLATTRIMQNKEKGIFHVVSTDMVSPYELASYILKKDIPIITFDAFIQTASNPKRYAKYCALDGSWTRKTLSLPARSWKEIVDIIGI